MEIEEDAKTELKENMKVKSGNETYICEVANGIKIYSSVVLLSVIAFCKDH